MGVEVAEAFEGGGDLQKRGRFRKEETNLDAARGGERKQRHAEESSFLGALTEFGDENPRHWTIRRFADGEFESGDSGFGEGLHGQKRAGGEYGEEGLLR